MTKEFAVEQAVGHAAAVQRDVIFLTGAGKVVQAAGDHFLAGAGFAENQHVDRSIRHIEDQLPNLGHLRRAADQTGFKVVTMIEATAQCFDFEHQLPFFQGAANDLDQIAG